MFETARTRFKPPTFEFHDLPEGRRALYSFGHPNWFDLLHRLNQLVTEEARDEVESSGLHSLYAHTYISTYIHTCTCMHIHIHMHTMHVCTMHLLHVSSAPTKTIGVVHTLFITHINKSYTLLGFQLPYRIIGGNNVIQTKYNEIKI